jgi:hypothetical protein
MYATGEEVKMRSPLATMQQDEFTLESNEVTALSCASGIRRTAFSVPGVIPASERVTRSDKHGFIFRYEIDQAATDQVAGNYNFKAIFVVWTKDCRIWEIATHPVYEIPAPPT